MSRITRLLTAVVLCLLARPSEGIAAPQMFSIDVAHSSVGFSVRHIVSRTTGRFNDFSGNIV